MKTKLLPFALSFMALTAYAQQKAGTFSITPKMGVTVSEYTGNSIAASMVCRIIPPTFVPPEQYFDQRVGEDYFDHNNKVGLVIGAEGEYHITDMFGLSLGVFYAQEGANYKGEGFTSHEGIKVNVDNLKVNLDCITVSILANIYVWKGLALKTGIQPEFAVGKKAKGDVTIEYDLPSYKETTFEKPNVKSFSLSIPVGVSYEFKNVVADLRYSFGITNIRSEKHFFQNSHSGSAYNRVLSFTLGYKFQ